MIRMRQPGGRSRCLEVCLVAIGATAPRASHASHAEWLSALRGERVNNRDNAQ